MEQKMTRQMSRFSGTQIQQIVLSWCIVLGFTYYIRTRHYLLFDFLNGSFGTKNHRRAHKSQRQE